MSMKRRIILLAILATGVVGFAVINKSGSGNDDAQSVAQASGSFQVDKKEVDFGNISVEDKKVAEFTVTNPSDQPLVLSNVGTSCMCTLAEVEIGGQKSPEFNMKMHNTPEMSRWQGTVAPRGQAIVRLTYIPKLMPVEGEIIRNVKFNTSDPNNAEVEIGIRTFVVK